jgi:D-glycero-alpha-D-manno-heptose-7-phosphate kinase
MIISRTPFRISYFGGGTDFPNWYNSNDGKVISTTINKYCYVNTRILPPFFKFKYRLRYYKIEEANSLSKIKHSSIRETLKYKNFLDKFELMHIADLPAQSGLGASSSFTVGLLNCVNAMQGKIPTKRQLANEALDIEQNKIKEFVGSQDQYAAAFGGFNVINFSKNSIQVKTVPNNLKNIKKLEESTILIFSGFQRKASLVEKKKINLIDQKVDLYRKINSITNEAEKLLTESDNIVRDYSELLKEYWYLKKNLANNVSNQRINNLIKYCLDSGAEGSKILGAGNGGFLMCLVKSQNKKKFLDKLQKKLIVPIKFENLGSQIVYYSENEKN